MAESNDDYETRMVRETVPRGLRSDYGAPPRERTPPPRDHLLGSTGEGRDKDVTPPKTPTDPIVQGDPEPGTGGSFPAVIVVSGVLYHCTVDGSIGAPVV